MYLNQINAANSCIVRTEAPYDSVRQDLLEEATSEFIASGLAPALDTLPGESSLQDWPNDFGQSAI